MDGWMDGWVDGWTWMDGWMDGWIPRTTGVGDGGEDRMTVFVD